MMDVVEACLFTSGLYSLVFTVNLEYEWSAVYST